MNIACERHSVQISGYVLLLSRSIHCPGSREVYAMPVAIPSVHDGDLTPNLCLPRILDGYSRILPSGDSFSFRVYACLLFLRQKGMCYSRRRSNRRMIPTGMIRKVHLYGFHLRNINYTYTGLTQIGVATQCDI